MTWTVKAQVINCLFVFCSVNTLSSVILELAETNIHWSMKFQFVSIWWLGLHHRKEKMDRSEQGFGFSTALYFSPRAPRQCLCIFKKAPNKTNNTFPAGYTRSLVKADLEALMYTSISTKLWFGVSQNHHYNIETVHAIFNQNVILILPTVKFERMSFTCHFGAVNINC